MLTIILNPVVSGANHSLAEQYGTLKMPKSTATITYRDDDGKKMPITREIELSDARLLDLQVLHPEKPADYFQKVADAVNNAQRQVSVTIPVKLDPAFFQAFSLPARELLIKRRSALCFSITRGS